MLEESQSVPECRRSRWVSTIANRCRELVLSESSFVLCSAVRTTRSVGYTGLFFTGSISERACSPSCREEVFSETHIQDRA